MLSQVSVGHLFRSVVRACRSFRVSHCAELEPCFLKKGSCILLATFSLDNDQSGFVE